MTKITKETKESIQTMILEGQNMAAVGRQMGLSRQRIKQIADNMGISSVVKIRRKKREETYFLKWGDREKSDLYDACREKFRRKKANNDSKHEWTIQFGHLEWVPRCPILDIELDYFAEKTQENSPSFDRIDSSKGYIPGNVQIISWRANRIKNDGTSEEHERIAQYIRERQEN